MEREKRCSRGWPFAEYKAGDNIVITSSKGRRLEWRVVEGFEALGSWLDARSCSEASLWHRLAKANSLFFAKKSPFCGPKIPIKRRIHAFYSTCMVQVNGLTLSQCSRHFASGS